MEQQKEDEKFMRQAFAVALASAKSGFDPFGALLVRAGEVVATSTDKCIQYTDPTSHAELILISEFCRKNQMISLAGYTLYCNVEPCVMCSGAIHWARISRVVFGVKQANLQSVSKGKEKPSCADLINIGHEKIAITGPVLSEEGHRVLQEYPFTSKQAKLQEYLKREADRKRKI